MIENAYIRLVNLQSNQELVRYNLSDNYMKQTAVIVATLTRDNWQWTFAAVGAGTTDASLNEIVRRY